MEDVHLHVLEDQVDLPELCRYLVDQVVEDLQQVQLQNLVDLETVLLLVPLKAIVEVQVMDNQVLLELVVEEVVQVVQELPHKYQVHKQGMVEMEQQILLQEVQ